MATVSTSTKLPAFERFVAYRRFGAGLAFTRDGAHVLFVSNISGQFNLWRQPSDGGYPRQLTPPTEEAVREVRWSPDGDTIVFSADRHGNEQYQLHVSPRPGLAGAIPGEPDVQHYVGPFSPDGRFVAYAANDREPTDQDVLVRDLECGETRRLLPATACSSPANGRRTAAADRHQGQLQQRRRHLPDPSPTASSAT